MSSLPVYRLAPAKVTTEQLLDKAAAVFDITDNFKLHELDGRIALAADGLTVELHTASGGVWAANEKELFNPDLRPKLLNAKKATVAAQEFVDSKKLLPSLPDGMTWGDPHVAGTKLATLTEKTRVDVDLDVQVVFPVLVGGHPVVGGGGDFTLVLGDGGRPIGFHGVWREATESFESVLLDPSDVKAEFAKQFEQTAMKLESVDVQLAYYAAPASVGQEFLYPVYTVGGSARMGEQVIPLRVALVPATEFGPSLPRPEPQAKRPSRARPPVRKPKENHATKVGARRSYATAQGGAPMMVPTKPWEAGASWIGVSGNLPGSQANAQGFIDQWRDDGWIIDFNWGDANAWESDWRRNDDLWVDNADFVFYTGHANLNGWTLASPDDGSLSFTEVGSTPQSPGDLWGQNDLEWVTIAACGPLQDAILATNGGDVLGRWDGAFDGLHLLMGYGSITFDNTEEGGRLARYARDGQLLRDAWFRTAKEIQPATNGASAPDGPTVWVGVMWASKPGADPINDHAWSHGSVASDPSSPTSLSCMWTVC